MAPNFSPDYIAEMKQLARQRGKYFAIAQLRQQHGLSLYEADKLMTAWDKGGGGEASTGGAQAAGGATREETLRAIAAPLIKTGRLIEAIKLVREQTGWGLKEAKDYLDRLQQNLATSTVTDRAPENRFSPDATLDRLITAIAPHVMKDKITAIKIIREHTGLGLKEAKEYSEAVQEALKKGWPPPLPPGSRPIVPIVSSPPPMPPPIPAAPVAISPAPPRVETPAPALIKPAASKIVDPPKPAWMSASPSDSVFKPAAIYDSPSRLTAEKSGFLDTPPPKPILDSPATPPAIFATAEPPPAPEAEDEQPSTQEIHAEWLKHHEAANAHRSISEPPAKTGCLVLFVLGGAAIIGAAIAGAIFLAG